MTIAHDDGTVDAVQIGGLIKTVRLRTGARQVDLARRTGMSQSAISRVEHGRFDRLSQPELERVCAALEIRLRTTATWRGADGARLLDREHAAIVEVVVRNLAVARWDVLVEYTFSHFGERGSVDVVAWHSTLQALLLVETKSAIVDIQDLLGTLDRKARVVPALLARDRGWRKTSLGRVLVVKDTKAARTAIARHRATFDRMLPGRTTASRQWLRTPVGDFGGVLFLAESALWNTRPGAITLRRPKGLVPRTQRA